MSTPVSPVAIDLLTKQLAHEIREQRKMVALRLHCAFLYMVEALESYRRHWQEAGAVTYQAAAEVGWNPPAAKWLRSRPIVFDAGLWSDYSDSLRKHATPGDQAQSDQEDEWVWWKESMQNVPDTSGIKLRPGREPRAASHDFSHGVTGNDAEFAAALREHRGAVFSLPTLIANGDKAGISDFLERVLPAIWPELAEAILASQDRQLIDDLLDEHESMLAWLAHMEILFDAIPPAMYAYIAGAGGGTLMLELRLLLPLLLLCTGRVVDNIIVEIGERLESSLPDGHDGLAFDWAPEVFTESLVQFTRAADEVHRIGALRAEGREDELQMPLVTRSGLATLKAAIHKDKSCRRCGSLEHRTSGPQVGTVDYE